MRTLSATTPDPNFGIGQDILFEVADELESLRQRVIFRLQFWLSQWFLDTSQGVPYRENILGYAYEESLARAVITDQVRGVPDVDDVSAVEVRLDNATRRLQISLQVHSRFGPLEVATTAGV